MTTIRSLQAQALDIELHTPFGIAGGAQDLARNVLVTVELEDGTRGYGEAAPFPVFNGETQQMVLSAVVAARSLVEGADVREWRRLALALRNSIGPVGSAQCAIAVSYTHLDVYKRQGGGWPYLHRAAAAVQGQAWQDRALHQG